MNVFVAIIVVLVGLAFVGFFVYEVIQLVRDIKKSVDKKKKAEKEKDNQDKSK